MIPPILSSGFGTHLVLPDDVAVARVQRVQRGIGSGIEHQVAVQRHRPRRVLTSRPDRAEPMFPDQVPRPRIECLHRVRHIRRQEHDAVVHQRRNLLPHAVFERPRPLQLQTSHVPGCDLIQRAVAPACVVAVVHQPIRVRRPRKHVFGDRRVRFDRAGYGETSTRCKRRRRVVVATAPASAAATATSTTAAAA